MKKIFAVFLCLMLLPACTSNTEEPSVASLSESSNSSVESDQFLSTKVALGNGIKGEIVESTRRIAEEVEEMIQINQLSNEIYKLRFVDSEDKPVTNLKCYTTNQWESFLSEEKVPLTSLSNNNGIMLIEVTDDYELDLIVTNTDTNGEHEFVELSLNKDMIVMMQDKNILKIVWDGSKPNDTVKLCDKVFHINIFERLHPDHTDGVSNSLFRVSNSLISINIYASYIKYNPDNNEEYIGMDLSLNRPTILVSEETIESINNGNEVLDLYYSTFDMRYADDDGNIEFKVNYLPDDFALGLELCELVDDSGNSVIVVARNRAKLFEAKSIFDYPDYDDYKNFVDFGASTSFVSESEFQIYSSIIFE